ncbi:hypothetical protein ACO1O0_003887 [Amphichorda felina]
MASSTDMEPSSSPPHREMKVLSVGLPRTGSTSIAAALSILGYQGVYHTSKAMNRPGDWAILEAAADATYTGQPFTRADWDALYAPFEATTDAASMFAPELIRAYPEAKVILVERDYARWHASIFDSLFPTVWNRATDLSLRVVEPLVGFRGGFATRKMLLGLFDARSPDEARGKAREAYDRHARRVREAVAGQPGRLLVYRLGDGWGPLCAFLGCEEPEEEFPWLNEAAMLRGIAVDFMVHNSIRAAGVVLPWAVGVGAAAVGVWMVVRRGGIGGAMQASRWLGLPGAVMGIFRMDRVYSYFVSAGRQSLG